MLVATTLLYVLVADFATSAFCRAAARGDGR